MQKFKGKRFKKNYSEGSLQSKTGSSKSIHRMLDEEGITGDSSCQTTLSPKSRSKKLS